MIVGACVLWALPGVVLEECSRERLVPASSEAQEWLERPQAMPRAVSPLEAIPGPSGESQAVGDRPTLEDSIQGVSLAQERPERLRVIRRAVLPSKAIPGPSGPSGESQAVEWEEEYREEVKRRVLESAPWVVR